MTQISRNPPLSDHSISPAEVPHVGVSIHELQGTSELLDDNQLASLLGSVGNNEGKALLLIAMAKESGTYAPRPLHELLTDLPGMEAVEAGGIRTQKSWCDSSLEPSGMVEAVASGGVQVSALGYELGVPLAGLLLDHADQYQVPLVELFGEARSSSGLSSQLIRLRIIEELLTNPGGVQLNDFVEASNASNQVVIEKQLRKISNAGLITYDDWDVSSSQTRYRVNPDSRDRLEASTRFSGTVAQYLLQTPEATHQDIINHCVEAEPDFAKLNPETQSSKVASTMHRLKHMGLVQKIEGREKPSELEISLNTEQLKQWTDLCNKLEAFKTRDPEVLAGWHKVALEFISDPVKVKEAYERYRDSSARANPSAKNLGSIVLSVLAKADGPTSVRDVVKQASAIRGSSVSHFGIVATLNRLAEEGLADKQQDRVLMFSKRQ